MDIIIIIISNNLKQSKTRAISKIIKIKKLPNLQARKCLLFVR